MGKIKGLDRSDDSDGLRTKCRGKYEYLDKLVWRQKKLLC